MNTKLFLPDLPVEYLVKKLGNAAGNEIESGKFASPQSSAALGNAFIENITQAFNPLPPFS